MPELETRCPCCRAPLLATMEVEDLGGDPERGHDYDVSLALYGPESCSICEAPFTTEGERLECEASRRRMA